MIAPKMVTMKFELVSDGKYSVSTWKPTFLFDKMFRFFRIPAIIKRVHFITFETLPELS